MEDSVITFRNRAEFRAWLSENHNTQIACWVPVVRLRPEDDEHLYYIDAVEEALCFGWIDSIFKRIDGMCCSRFSPRRKGSPWTELNKERVRRMESLGLMTDAGRKVLPAMGTRSFKPAEWLVELMKKHRVYAKFKTFPALYQRVRAYNLQLTKKRSDAEFDIAFKQFVTQTKQGKMYGNWNDYGRLSLYSLAQNPQIK